MNTDFFCQMTSQPRFAYKLIEATPFQVHSHTNLHCVSSMSVHSWVLLHPIKANWLFMVCFLLSVAEIRSDQSRLDCAHGAHTILSNSDPFTASACQLNCSTCPICPLAFPQAEKLIFNKHSLKVDLNRRLLGQGFPSASKINEMALGSSESFRQLYSQSGL